MYVLTLVLNLILEEKVHYLGVFRVLDGQVQQIRPISGLFIDIESPFFDQELHYVYSGTQAGIVQIRPVCFFQLLLQPLVEEVPEYGNFIDVLTQGEETVFQESTLGMDIYVQMLLLD